MMPSGTRTPLDKAFMDTVMQRFPPALSPARHTRSAVEPEAHTHVHVLTARTVVHYLLLRMLILDQTTQVQVKHLVTGGLTPPRGGGNGAYPADDSAAGPSSRRRNIPPELWGTEPRGTESSPPTQRGRSAPWTTPADNSVQKEGRIDGGQERKKERC